MLKQLRNRKTQKQIYIALAVIIIPSFIITGVVLFAPQEGMNASATLGSIGNRKASLQQYLTNYKATMRQAQLIYGDRYNQVRQ